MTENTARKWLGAVYPGRIEWIEPTRRSSFGIPDARVALIAGWKLPLELKYGPVDRLIRMKIRPAQRRYHILEAEEDRRTAFLYLGRDRVQTGGNSFGDSRQRVFVMPGKLAATNDFLLVSNPKVREVGVFKGFSEKNEPNWQEMQAIMEVIFADESFWD